MRLVPLSAALEILTPNLYDLRATLLHRSNREKLSVDRILIDVPALVLTRMLPGGVARQNHLLRAVRRRVGSSCWPGAATGDFVARPHWHVNPCIWIIVLRRGLA